MSDTIGCQCTRCKKPTKFNPLVVTDKPALCPNCTMEQRAEEAYKIVLEGISETVENWTGIGWNTGQIESLVFALASDEELREKLFNLVSVARKQLKSELTVGGT